MIIIGLNKNGLDANSGITYDPEGRNTEEKEIARYYYEPLVNLIAVFLILTGISLLVYIKKYKEKKRDKHVSKNIDATEYSAKITESQVQSMNQQD